MDQIDFQFVASQALIKAREFLADWLPDGRVSGSEYVALNPTRVDHHLGSFRINIQTGRWADFVVLRQNPLEDVLATRSIVAVYIGGRAVQR